MNANPKNIAEAKRIGLIILNKACDDMVALFGERPKVVDQGHRLVIVWADGEETNEMTFQDISDQQSLSQ